MGATSSFTAGDADAVIIHIPPGRWLYILSWTSHGRILGYPQTTDSSGMDSFAPISKIDGLNWAFNVLVSCFVSHL